MNKAKQSRLESKGWKVGTADEFFDYTRTTGGAVLDIAVNPETGQMVAYSSTLKESAIFEIKQQPYF